MRVSASALSSLAVLVLAKDVLAAAHRAHRHSRLTVTTTSDDVVTVTDYVYVTVEWPPASPSATPTTDAGDDVVAVTTIAPVAVPTTTPVVVLDAASSSSPIEVDEFFVKGQATTTPPVPTTLATVVKGGAPTTSQTAAVVPSSAPVTTSGGKRGLAYNDASLTNAFSSSAITWAYNWGSSTSGLRSGLEFCPMLWGMSSEFTGPWVANANAAIAAGSTHLLGFNEPDLAAQSNLDVATAVAGYKQYMQPFAGKALLGSPAVTNGGGSMGLTYLSNFVTQCTGCTIDFVNIHWYDSASNLAYFKDHVTQAHTLTGKPVWITEFGASGSDADQATFITEAIAWLDAQSFVERYAYFMVSAGLLVNSASSLTTVGVAFNA